MVVISLIVCIVVLQTAKVTTERVRSANITIMGTGSSTFAALFNKLSDTYDQKNKNVTARFHPGYDTLRYLTHLLSDNSSYDYLVTSRNLTSTSQISSLIEIPIFIWTLTVVFNLPKYSDSLRLSRQQQLEIFEGTLNKWKLLNTTNENLMTTPCGEILVLKGQPKSETITDMIAAMKYYKDTFDAKYLQSKGLYNNFLSAVGEFGVFASVMAIECSLGIMSSTEGLAARNKESFKTALLESNGGKYEDYLNIVSPEEFLELKIESKVTQQSLSALIRDKSYPLSILSNLYIKKETPNCQKAKHLYKYFEWLLKSEDADTIFTQSLVKRVSEKCCVKGPAFLSAMTCNGGTNVQKLITEENVKQSFQEMQNIILICVGVLSFIIIVGTVIITTLLRKGKKIETSDKDDWLINFDDITFMNIASTSMLRDTATANSDDAKQDQSRWSISSDDYIPRSLLMQWPGYFHDQVVGVRMLGTKSGVITLSNAQKQTLMYIKDKINHSNILRFYGLTDLGDELLIVSNFCLRGSLDDALFDETVNFGNDVKAAIAYDIASGMAYLHSEGIVHGLLRSSCCLIDSRWTVKIADWEFHKLEKIIRLGGKDCKKPFHLKMKETLLGLNQSDAHLPTTFDYKIAPELLRTYFHVPVSESTDMYSYAVLIFEIFNRRQPYEDLEDMLSVGNILNAIVSKGLRPHNTPSVPVKIRQIMEISWSDDPMSRPSFDNLMKMLKKAFPRRKQMLESMVQTLEKYTHSLEDEIRTTDTELIMGRSQCQSLLRSALPDNLAENIFYEKKETVLTKRLIGILVIDAYGLRKVCVSKRTQDIGLILNDFNYTVSRLSDSYDDTFTSIYLGDVYIIFCGLNRPSTRRNVTQLADLALELRHQATVMGTHGNDVMVDHKCSLHCGSLIVDSKGNHSPRLSVFGAAIEELDALRNLTGNGEILLSNRVANILKSIEEKRYHLSIKDIDTKESIKTVFLLHSSSKQHKIGGVMSSSKMSKLSPGDLSSDEEISPILDISQLSLKSKPVLGGNPRGANRLDLNLFSQRNAGKVSQRRKQPHNHARSPHDQLGVIHEQSSAEVNDQLINDSKEDLIHDSIGMDDESHTPRVKYHNKRMMKYEIYQPRKERSWFSRKHNSHANEIDKEIFFNHVRMIRKK